MTGATAEKRAAIRRLQITASRELAGLLSGACRSRFRGQGMEFSDLRPYLPGDDIRRIDWPSTARTGLPYTRIYEEERSRTITLLADISSSCTPRKRRLLSETSGLLAFAAIAGGDRVGLITFSDRVEQLLRPIRGVRQAQRISSELFNITPKGNKTDLKAPLRAAQGMNRNPGLFILLSDLHCDLPLDQLRQITHQHDLVTLVLRDGIEIEPPPAGLTLFQDAESGTTRLLSLGSQKQREAIAELWRKHDHELMQALQSVGSRTTVLRSDHSPLSKLLQLFRQGGNR